MNKIHINEQYGSIEMPSQIADSFQNSHEDSQNSHEHISSPIKHKTNQSNLKYSKYVDEHGHIDIIEQDDQINLSSSFQDTFLANLPLLIATKNQQKDKTKQNKRIVQDDPDISLSKTSITRNVLPNEQFVEYIQAINSSSNPIILSISSPAQIQVISNQAYQKNFDQYLNYTNVRQLYLEAWQKIEIGFKIKKNNEQIGDIFETICLETRLQKPQKQIKKKRSYIEVQVHYITPKLKINYQGCSDVATISFNKVSMNKISKNKFGEYSLMLGASGLQRFQCSLEARGDITVFPTEAILYKEESKKINFKINGKSNRGAIIIKAKNAKVSFVLGVQLL